MSNKDESADTSAVAMDGQIEVEGKWCEGGAKAVQSVSSVIEKMARLAVIYVVHQPDLVHDLPLPLTLAADQVATDPARG